MNKVIEVIHHLRRAALLRDGAGLTDAQLLGYFVEDRDEAAFAALVKQQGPMVWGVCRRLLNQHDAEDAFQTTFLVLVRKAASIVPRERVANWLYGVAHQTALQVRRTTARRKAREKQVLEMPEPAAIEQDVWRELQPLLDQELSRLPDAYREVIVLSDLEGKTRKEVARQLGLPEGTVGSRVARARTMLAKRLARHGLTLSGATLAAVLAQKAASASVPSSVLSSTIEAATLVAAGHEAASMISVKVVALTTGVLKTMFGNKITVATTVLLALSFLTAGGSLLTYQNFKAGEPKPQRSPPDAGQVKQGRNQKGSLRPAAEPSRAERLKAIRDAYTKERDKFSEAIRAGKIKPDAEGEYPGWFDMHRRYANSARKLIEEDPADEVACDAIVFCITELGNRGYRIDTGMYRLLYDHHLASEKIAEVLHGAPAFFLDLVAAKSPHAKVRLWANYHLAAGLYKADKAKEAEPLLEAVSRDEDAKKLGGYVMGTLADTANRLLFEVRRLNVGQEMPEIEGTDLDGKPMKLSESRGKVTLLVYWATWCGPCMQMIPHERALAERFADKPFVLVGVNGDTLPDKKMKIKGEDGKLYNNIELRGADGKVWDDSAKVKAAVEKHKISWRSFRNGQFTIALDWNVRTWPTLFLIDHRGILRGKWKGDPGEKTLDKAIEDLVRLAENAKDKK
ncbi:MAG TPA: sigma-70 family RNA polymerase sigma factor [Gemmataceae bacterium]